MKRQRVMLFLVLYVAGILYLSLYPWRWVARPGLSLVWVPLVTRRTVFDAFLNVIFYVPVGAAAYASFRRGARGIVAVLALGLLVSFAVEWFQLSLPNRFGNLTDLASNTLGTLTGAAIAVFLTSPPLAARLRFLNSPAALLLALWVVWQAFTFLLPRNWSSMDASHEIAGLLVLALLWYGRGVRSPGAMRLAALGLLLWLALDELRPFRFMSPPQTFWWLPFASWFAGAAESYYSTFFGKLFLDMAILWVERRCGMSWITALAAPGAILAAGEFAQRYLPGRTPETTDLALLAAGAVLLNLVEPGDPSNGLHNKGSA